MEVFVIFVKFMKGFVMVLGTIMLVIIIMAVLAGIFYGTQKTEIPEIVVLELDFKDGFVENSPEDPFSQ